jgi:hypothetical protein
VAISDGIRLRRRLVAMRRRDAGPPSGVVAAFYSLLEEAPKLVPA